MINHNGKECVYTCVTGSLGGQPKSTQLCKPTTLQYSKFLKPRAELVPSHLLITATVPRHRRSAGYSNGPVASLCCSSLLFAENQPFLHGKLPKMQCSSNMYCYSRFQGSSGWFSQGGLTWLTSAMNGGPGLSWVEIFRLEISRQVLSWYGSPQPHGLHGRCEASLGFSPAGLEGSESSKTAQTPYLRTALYHSLEEIEAHVQLEAMWEGLPRGMNAGRVVQKLCCKQSSTALLPITVRSMFPGSFPGL